MKICIVGNSPNVFQVKAGKFIDECDIIIRMNDFRFEGFEEYVGSRVDVCSYSFSPENNIEKKYISQAQSVWCCRPLENKRLKVAKNKLPRKFEGDIVYPNADLWKGLCQIVKDHWRGQPSSGLATVGMARNMWPEAKIYLYGFDRELHKRHFFDSSFIDVGKVGHDWEAEMDYFEKCEKDNLLEFIREETIL